MRKINIIIDKIYRKVHYLFWHKCRPGKWGWLILRSYRHYLFSKIFPVCKGKEQTLYMTQIPNRGAGIGHQLGNWNSGYWYAKLFEVEHAYASFSNQSWDSFLGFGEGEISVQELKKKGYRIRKLPYFGEKEYPIIKRIIESYSGRKIIFCLMLDQFYEDQYGVMEHIQKKFYSAKARENETLIYDNAYKNIAVHIRRGDIVQGQETQNTALTKRWLSTQYYVEQLKRVLQEIGKVYPYKVYIFSEGKKEDFPELEGIGHLNFCLDMGAKESFLHMVKADILFTSKSSFSYKPALLSKGIKVCPMHFWHGYPKKDDWIVVDEEKNITEEQVKQIMTLLKP